MSAAMAACIEWSLDSAELAHCWMLLAILSAVRGDPERALDRHRACLGLTEPAGEV